jgi:hypothetical protein
MAFACRPDSAILRPYEHMSNPLPILANVPNTLPHTQGDWGTFQNVLQQWKNTLGPPVWIAPKLLNSWVAYTTAGYNPVGYYLDVTGRVYLRGMLNGNTASLPSTIFQLSAKPAYKQVLQGQAYNSTPAYVTTQITVDTSGNVALQALSAGSLTNSNATFVCLDSLSFSLQP